jgi:hypothetical protein
MNNTQAEILSVVITITIFYGIGLLTLHIIEVSF